jgi:hypothetical protein
MRSMPRPVRRPGAIRVIAPLGSLDHIPVPFPSTLNHYSQSCFFLSAGRIATGNGCSRPWLADDYVGVDEPVTAIAATTGK